jgi:antitoxin (DNA-binding transcriptional repressor) of toxin-antitoxin stability system
MPAAHPTQPYVLRNPHSEIFDPSKAPPRPFHTLPKLKLAPIQNFPQIITTHEIGTFEANNQLSALLERVEKGEEILITRHGKPVARLVLPEGAQPRQNAAQAAQRIQARAATIAGPFNWPEWKSFRDEGRR